MTCGGSGCACGVAVIEFAIALVCAGISEQEEETLRQQLLQIDPAVVVTRHYGGGSGLLENEVLTILHQKSLK